MTLSALSSQTSQSLTSLLAKLKAEQEKESTTGGAPSLQSLGTQIVQALETSRGQSQTAASDEASSPLAKLLAAASPEEAQALAKILGGDGTTQTGTASTSLSNLSALLAKTQPGPAGDRARAAIVANLTTGQDSPFQAGAGSADATPSLFSFLS